MPSRRWARLVRVASVAVLSASGAVALVPTAASAATGAVLADAGCQTSTLAANDDGSTGAIDLPSTLHFFDRQVSKVYVNNNGNLSFVGPVSSYSGGLGELSQPLVAPFFADVDTSISGSGRVTYGTTTYGGHQAFCATWPAVRGYGSVPGSNSFQALLVDRSDLTAGDFDVVFNYDQVQWDRGTVSTLPAQVGFNAADGNSQHVYVFPGSGTSGRFLDSNTSTGLVRGKRDTAVLGRYIFHFRNGALTDVPPPDTSLTLQPADLGNAVPAFTYTSTAATGEHGRFDCRITAQGQTPGAWETCPDGGTSYPALADGTWTFQVRAADVYFNADATPASATFTLDRTGPTTTVDAKPASLGNDTTPSFTWSSTATDVASYECRLDGPGTEGTWTACADGQQYDALADGDWRFAVRATDDLGNTGTPASYDFTVDTDAPATTFTTTPEALSNDTTPTFAWTSEATDVDYYECTLVGAGTDEPVWARCAADGTTLTDVGEGEWTFKVRATDTAGNTGDAVSHDFAIDTTGPDTVLEDTPKALGNDTTPSFTWSSTSTDVASYECLLDGPATEGTWTACTSGDSLGDLTDGGWTFKVRATDDLGNTGTPASYDFTVDTEAPATTFTTTPEALSNDTTPTFAWTSEATDVDSYECQLSRPGSSEPSPWETCTSGDPLTDLADGDWTFTVRATDTAANTGEAVSHDFAIDTDRPGAPVLTSTPKALGNDSTPSFTWTSDVADLDHFECLVSGAGARSGSPTACDAAGLTSTSLADGDWTFTVVAIDTAGNASAAASYDFTVDTVAPETTITTTPEAVVATGSVTFGFGSDKDPSSFECRLVAAGQAGDWQSCAGTSKAFTGLAAGTWTFEVRATDAAGNTDATPASRSVSVDLAQPTITASLSSKHPISSFGWHRGPVTITYTCVGNGSAVVACPAPRVVARAQRGRTFKASVRTADGDTATVSTTLYIDKGAPKAAIKGFSGKQTYTSVPKKVRCVASDPRSGLADCTVTVRKVTRKNGVKLIVVRAKAVDKAGNVRVVRKQAPFRAA